MRTDVLRVRALLWLVLIALLLRNEALAETHHVQVEDFEFIPANLVIAPGDTVVWHANAPDHTVTADDLSFDSSPLPDVVTIPTGTTFSHTFSAAGRKHYYCRLHGRPLNQSPAPGSIVIFSVPDDSMTGVIRVVDASANTSPETPVNTVPVNNATGLSISPLLVGSAFSDANVDDIHGASQWIIRKAGTGDVVLDTGADTEHLTELRLSNLEPSITYEWQVRYQDDLGAWSAYSTATLFTVAGSVGAGSGLKGTYFTYDPKRDIITKQAAVRVDPTLDFEWGLGKPHPAAPANNFFIYWEGSIVPEFSEEYRLRVNADGGVRLWINGQVVIDDPVASTFAIYRSGTVTLEAGIPASIRIQYFDTKGSASIHLRWSSLNRPLEVIPQERLLPTP
jgi:plastocyanin